MRHITVCAPAKLNLTLDILGLREDGYHDLKMLMQAVSLCDALTIAADTGEAWTLSCTAPGGERLADVPCDERNLAWRAAECFFRHTGIADNGLAIHISKRIPSQAGLAGGSADAAAVLRGLNALYGFPLTASALCALGARCGSDVPFCVLGGTAMVQGRGELLTAVPMQTVQHYVICKPAFGISTPRLYALSDQYPATVHPQPEALITRLRLDAPKEAGGFLYNVLEAVAVREYPQLRSIRQDLLEAGACGARMTGSGSAVFGLFPGEKEAKFAYETLKKNSYAVFYAHSV